MAPGRLKRLPWRTKRLTGAVRFASLNTSTDPLRVGKGKQAIASNDERVAMRKQRDCRSSPSNMRAQPD